MSLSMCALFGIVLYNNLPTESRKVTPDGIVHEGFIEDAFRRITTHRIETIIVNKLGLCAFKCVQNGECLSFNFGNPVKGTHVCELLRTDKYNARPSYNTSTDFHYFFSRNKCMDPSSCQNNGSCYPDYENNDYNCVCVKGVKGRNCEIGYRDCWEIRSAGFTTDGVYHINPDGQGFFSVFCDMTTDGGGWTVFQKRFDGSVDFYRRWQDYKTGFGDLTGEFWLGNDKIHRLTRTQNQTLRVDLGDWNAQTTYARYMVFTMGNEDDSYRLNVSGFEGTTADSLASGHPLEVHNGMQFTTRDRDNDGYAEGSCALNHEGAWWYNKCYRSNLNGKYSGNVIDIKGMVWQNQIDARVVLKKAEMKIKPSY